MRRKDREGPSVRSHWGQRMAATFTKANSLEEQSTSPVAVDYSIITSTGLTVSHFALLTIQNSFNVQNGVCYKMLNYNRAPVL